MGVTKKIVPHVWVKWKEHTPDEMIFAFDDILSKDNFLSKLLKNHADIQKCTEIFRKVMPKLFGFQRLLQQSSRQYPLISFDQVMSAFDSIQSEPDFDNNMRLEEDEIKRAFICTHFDEITDDAHRIKLPEAAELNLVDGLKRSDLFTMILIAAKIYIYKYYNCEDTCCSYLYGFLKKYVSTYADTGQSEEQRKSIKCSKRLNELLYDNLNSIKDIANHIKGLDPDFEGNNVSMGAIQQFFNSVKCHDVEQHELEHHLVITTELVKTSFINSLMTILNEFKSIKKYDAISQVEFLEMICRIAMFGY